MRENKIEQKNLSEAPVLFFIKGVNKGIFDSFYSFKTFGELQ